jgi:uncharacterized membrane protein
MATLVHTVAVAVVAGLNLVVTAIICSGALAALIQLVVAFGRPAPLTPVLLGARLSLARWLSLALEFAVAADIVLMAVTPSWNELGMLAAVVALRMALNYSLERELAAANAADQPSS